MYTVAIAQYGRGNGTASAMYNASIDAAKVLTENSQSLADGKFMETGLQAFTTGWLAPGECDATYLTSASWGSLRC
jgi:hypothetical protein